MRAIYIICLCSTIRANVAFAEDVHWITGVGKTGQDNIALRYGTDGVPLSWFDTSKWFTDDPRPTDPDIGLQTPNNAIPTDGQSVAHTNSCCNPEPFVSIDNGGNGVNLPSSAIRFDAKTNLFDSGAGDLTDLAGGSYDFTMVDDGLVADTVAFNGAGGAANDIYVPVVANTLTSNRHGARFFAPITVTTILARSSHQDRWEINASPAATIDSVVLDERRGPDGGNIDGSFSFNADTSVTTLDHVWSRLRVGAGANLTVDTFNYTFYTNQVDNNADNPIVLDGDMLVATFNMIDIVDGVPVEQADGTWGAVGSGADNEVSWITGDGLLTIGTGIGPRFEITDIDLLANDMVSLTWNSKPNTNYTVFFSIDGIDFGADAGDNFSSQGDTTTHIFPNPSLDGDPATVAPTVLFKVSENAPAG